MRTFPMIVTTTNVIDGQPVQQYLGIVCGEAILGANAIIGMDLDYETVGSGGAMLMVSASGTAVRI